VGAGGGGAAARRGAAAIGARSEGPPKGHFGSAAVIVLYMSDKPVQSLPGGVIYIYTSSIYV
jgi:hypothetical protein